MNRRLFRPAGVAAILAGALAFAPSSAAAPNPYGDKTTSAVITIDDTGGYQAVETMRQAMVGEGYDANLNADRPTGFRLPATKEQQLPPILVPSLEVRSATLNGAQLKDPVTSVGRVLQFRSGETGKKKGDFEAMLTYAVTGAGIRLPGATTVAVHVRPFIFESRSAEVTLRGKISAVRCITVAPDSVPCGTKKGDGWTVTANDVAEASPASSYLDRPPRLELIVEIPDTGQKLVEPVIDRT